MRRDVRECCLCLGVGSVRGEGGSPVTPGGPASDKALAHGEPLPGIDLSPSLTSANPTPAIETRCTAGWLRSTPAPAENIQQAGP